MIISNSLVPKRDTSAVDRIFDGSAKLMESAQPFMELLMHNECALREIETKLNVLNDEFSLQYNYNPIESIKTRVKDPMSIVEKMKRKGITPTIENIENTLNDIAGIRVICSFPEDIYAIAEMLIRQDDIKLISQKDYIANPKPNGYRSLHLIVEIPIFLSKGKKFMKVEVQFRTIAMDFWASLEHKMRYKKNIENAEEIAAELKLCSEAINTIDYRMQDIRNRIEKSK
ncbi:MAG: GTP pyrophosphokinase family protein [Oscillospiraceae bacterium]|nr:GTP pyrophosphokinase family protein [Oscillospiraceae bacterium]